MFFFDFPSLVIFQTFYFFIFCVRGLVWFSKPNRVPFTKKIAERLQKGRYSSTIQYNTIQYNTIRYDIQYDTIYNTTQYIHNQITTMQNTSPSPTKKVQNHKLPKPIRDELKMTVALKGFATLK